MSVAHRVGAANGDARQVVVNFHVTDFMLSGKDTSTLPKNLAGAVFFRPIAASAYSTVTDTSYLYILPQDLSILHEACVTSSLKNVRKISSAVILVQYSACTLQRVHCSDGHGSFDSTNSSSAVGKAFFVPLSPQRT